MKFPRPSAAMLSASLVLLLCLTTSSGWSHDPTSSELSRPYRVKRDLPFETRPQVDASLIAAREILNAINEKFDKMDMKTLAGVMTAIGKIAGFGVGIGGLVSSLVNVVLVFIPQDDPVMNAVTKGFAEVNRKMDSMAFQIFNLATDVEWFNYVSVYSQDEVRILNSWKKFEELCKTSLSVRGEDEKLRLAEIFANFYEDTATEASVANLFHYLTVTNTSLSGNINNLLRRKFKCDISEISNYNIHFSILLWKGMVLDQFYWRLIGSNTLEREAQQAQKSKQVYAAQISAVDYCIDNYKEYMRTDVVEIGKSLDTRDKKAVAVKVQHALNKKYFWYNWVVMVYNADKDGDHILHNMMKFLFGTINVAVGYTEKEEELLKAQIEGNVGFCFDLAYHRMAPKPSLSIDTPCENFREQIAECGGRVAGVRFELQDYIKVMHTSYNDIEFVAVPEPLKINECTQGANWHRSKIYTYYSRTINACPEGACEEGVRCKRLGMSSKHLCECPDGYRKDKCVNEDKEPENVPVIEGLTLPDITTINRKLKLIEDKLDAVLNNRCPAQ